MTIQEIEWMRIKDPDGLKELAIKMADRIDEEVLSAMPAESAADQNLVSLFEDTADMIRVLAKDIA